MPVPRTEREQLKVYPFAPFLKSHPPPLTDVCESPLVCVAVNAEWASFIIGALDALDQMDLWLGTDEEKEAAVQKVRSIISMFSNPCDDSSSEYTRIINQWWQYQTTLEGLYDGTPESIDEDAPDTDFDSDSSDTGLEIEYRDNALCNACRIFVDIFCAELLAQAGFYQNALNILAGLLAASLGIAGGVFGLIFVAAVDVLVGLTLGSLENEEARKNVACCLYDNLKGQAVNIDNFCAMLGGCYETGSSAENDIMNGLRNSDYCRRGNYVAFLKILAEQFRYARAGITEPCECGCLLVVSFDLEDDSYEVVEGGRALLSGENYVINGDAYTDSGQFGDRALVTIPYELDCPVDGVTALFRFDHGSANNNINLRCTLKLGGVTQDEIDITEEWTKNAWNTKVFEVFAESVDEIEIEVAFQNTIESDGKFVQLDDVKVNG